MARMVILEHVGPLGPPHFDWLIQRPGHEDAGPDDRQLWAFRTSVRPDDPGAGVFIAHRAPDHRVVYLDFQGELSGGRGVVTRVAAGWVSRADELTGGLAISGEFEGPAGRSMAWRLDPAGGDAWVCRRMDDPGTTP